MRFAGITAKTGAVGQRGWKVSKGEGAGLSMVGENKNTGTRNVRSWRTCEVTLTLYAFYVQLKRPANGNKEYGSPFSR